MRSDGLFKLQDNSIIPFLITTVALFLCWSPEFSRQPAELSLLPGVWDVNCSLGSGTCHLHDGRLWLKGVGKKKTTFFWSCKGSSWRPCSLLTPKCLRLDSTTYLGNPFLHLLTLASRGGQMINGAATSQLQEILSYLPSRDTAPKGKIPSHREFCWRFPN